MSRQQVEELRTISPYSHEEGFAAFARRHGFTVNHVYYMRKKLGMAVVPLPRWETMSKTGTPYRSDPVKREALRARRRSNT